MATTDYEVYGKQANALFSLKIYRGEGMALLAMNWKTTQPPLDFVGFAIEYKEPGGTKFFSLNNRLAFPGTDGKVNPTKLSTRLSPIQMFRWVHFPRNAELKGGFTYRVTPVFMNAVGVLSYGDYQECVIALARETYPDLNVTFTRGFVASQAFVDYYESAGPINTLLPPKADQGLTFNSTHPKKQQALSWMGFEARHAILEVLDIAIANTATKVYVVAYDLNEPEIVDRLKQLGNRLQIIIDDDGAHGKNGSAENLAEEQLSVTAGAANVKRQHMGQLQHNKTIIVTGGGIDIAICGSTNFAWRGLYVQNNNALILKGATAVTVFKKAFDQYWASNEKNDFAKSIAAVWHPLGIPGVDVKVTFSPHNSSNAMLDEIGNDITTTQSSLLYSLAFLSQVSGSVRKAVTNATLDSNLFVYGISDKKSGGFDLLKPDGNIAPVYSSALKDHLPEPFRSEPTGGGGTRMHHKFVVIDFDKPTARVYMGSYNFSPTADTKNGENLLLIRDKKIAIAYMIEALRIFDHYHFRVSKAEAKSQGTKLTLKPAPVNGGDLPWWHDHYNQPIKIKDRILFAT